MKECIITAQVFGNLKIGKLSILHALLFLSLLSNYNILILYNSIYSWLFYNQLYMVYPSITGSSYNNSY